MVHSYFSLTYFSDSWWDRLPWEEHGPLYEGLANKELAREHAIIALLHWDYHDLGPSWTILELRTDRHATNPNSPFEQGHPRIEYTTRIASEIEKAQRKMEEVSQTIWNHVNLPVRCSQISIYVVCLRRRFRSLCFEIERTVADEQTY